MGNHFHLVTKMHPGKDYSDTELENRFERYYGEGKRPGPEQLPFLRNKWESLSEFVKEIKQGFSRYYNRKHNRRGFFWGERFKSVIVENGETLINLLAYVDFHPVKYLRMKCSMSMYSRV
jgi:putative transposase